MIANPGKFQAIILDKKKKSFTSNNKIDKNSVKDKSSVKLLGFQTDAIINFNVHIANICRFVGNQLHARIRLKFLSFKEKKLLINSCFYSNFNYCPLVWIFSHTNPLKKVEVLQKSALLFLYE